MKERKNVEKYLFYWNNYLHLNTPLGDVVNLMGSQTWRNKFLVSVTNVPILILADAERLTDRHQPLCAIALLLNEVKT